MKEKVKTELVVRIDGKDERMAVAEKMYVRGHKRWETVNFIAERFGVSKATAEADWDEAKKRLQVESVDSLVNLRARCSAMLLEFIQNDEVRPQERIRAIEAFAKLWGLNKIPITNEDIGKIEVDVIDWRGQFQLSASRNELPSAERGGDKPPLADRPSREIPGFSADEEELTLGE